MTDAAVEDVRVDPASTPTHRSERDVLVRRLLRIPATPSASSKTDAEATFSASLLVSALRCLLTYVVLPFVGPAVGVAAGVGPWIGIPLSGVAIVANVVSIRRFWIADHRWRWPYTVVALGVIALLAVLAVGDVLELAR